MFKLRFGQRDLNQTLWTQWSDTSFLHKSEKCKYLILERFAIYVFKYYHKIDMFLPSFSKCLGK